MHAQMELGDEQDVEEEQRAGGEDAVQGEQSCHVPCPDELRRELPEARRHDESDEVEQIPVRIGQKSQKRRAQQQDRHTDQLDDAGGGKDLPFIVLLVETVTDDGFGDGEGDDGNDEIGGLLQERLGGGIAGVDIGRIEPGQEQQQYLRAKAADGKNDGILRQFFIFIQNLHSFRVCCTFYYNRFYGKRE